MLYYIQRLGMKGGQAKLRTDEKIKLLQELLEKRYPVEVYDKTEKTSIFRLRVDKILNKLYKLEEELK